jgi:hypothetical protein
MYVPLQIVFCVLSHLVMYVKCVYVTRFKTLDIRQTHPQEGRGSYDSIGHTVCLRISGHEPWYVRKLDAWLTVSCRGARTWTHASKG